ncbi:MAG: hypothetical protein SGI71_10540 [Verrucomicrobiota bacterium]|nr:hypothetical protein [Verrucomicrobiota bacterium]
MKFNSQTEKPKGAVLLCQLLAVASVLTMLPSCAAPAPGSLTYQPRMTPEERSASQQHIAQVEEVGRQQRARELMDEAEANEVATRNNPTSVSTTTVTPFFFW